MAPDGRSLEASSIQPRCQNGEVVMRFKSPDPVAIVTGGGSGIGEAICHLLAEHGVRVAVIDRVAENAMRVASAIADAGGKSLTVVGDISVQEEVTTMLTSVDESYGRLDILVNNAGVWWPDRDGRTTDLEPSMWQQVLDVNLTGTFLMCRAALPHIVQSGGGSVINVSSSAAIVGWAGMDAYTASKGAVVALTRSLAVEYGPSVRINAVCPGAIETPLTRDVQRTVGYPSNPLERVGRPEDVAWPVVFLASEASAYMTGEYLMVDGGRRASL